MEKTKVRTLIRQVRGVSYKPEDLHNELDDNSVILLRSNNIDEGKINFDDVVYVDKSKVSDEQYLKDGDILICASSGSKNLVGKAASIRLNMECTFGAFCKVVRPNEGIEEYLGVYFQSPIYRRKISEVAIGANINNIRNEHIDELDIPVFSNDEQVSIAKRMHLIQGVISNRKAELEKLDDLIKARFVEMFGDPIYNTNKLPMKFLDDIGEWASGGTPSRTIPEYFEGDINWYSAGELNSLFLEDSIEKITKEAVEKSSAKLFKAGSMLVGMYDTAAFKMGILNENSASNQACACITPNDEVNIIWLYYELQLMKEHFLSQRRGVRQKNLNLGMIKKFEIPIANRVRQDKFADFVHQVNKSKVVVQKALDETQILFNSLMQQYFG